MTRPRAAGRFHGLATGLNKIARPYLTVLVTTVYNVTLVAGVASGKLDFEQYVMTVGPTNALIIGFWFGERAASSRAQKDGDGG